MRNEELERKYRNTEISNVEFPMSNVEVKIHDATRPLATLRHLHWRLAYAKSFRASLRYALLPNFQTHDNFSSVFPR
jgi:hypothetical protein